MGSISIIFLLLWPSIWQKTALGKKGLLCPATSQGRHGSKTWGGCSYWICNQEAERSRFWCLPHFSNSIWHSRHSGNTDSGKVSPDQLNVVVENKTQKCVSRMNLSLVKLTLKINHHTQLEKCCLCLATHNQSMDYCICFKRKNTQTSQKKKPQHVLKD